MLRLFNRVPGLSLGIILIGAVVSLPIAAATSSDEAAYPRIYDSGSAKVRLDQPVIRDWAGLRTLTGAIPVTISRAGQTDWSGSVAFDVHTQIDLDNRMVNLDDLKLNAWQFDQGDLPAEMRSLVGDALEAGTDHVPLDNILRALPADFQIPGSDKPPPRLNLKPPRIVVSNKPMRLMLIDGQPSMQDIDSTELEYVINSDWEIFHHKSSDRWYLLDDGHWLANTMLSSGSWLQVDALPADFENLRLNSYWPQIAAAMPPTPPQHEALPFTISYEPTELVLIDGETQVEVIPGTVIRYVKNTSSDLFVLADRYYLLASGRWFMTKDFKRMWSAVKQLPPAFAAIPIDHVKSYVRASVPGTEEARLAMIEAAIPRYAEFSLDAGDGIEVAYAGDPSFVPIEGTLLQRAENTPYQVIQHNNFYYLCHDGAWFSSTRPQGPWQVATEVPEAIYTIPPTDPAYNVTFVRLEAFDDSSDKVAYTKTAGYYRIYSNGYSTVYGTGWHYPGHIHTGAYGYNSYWRYPYSYGVGGWYPYGSRYGYGGHYGYYPYSYNSSATYSLESKDKDWKWDLEGNKRRVYDYAPQNYVGSGQYVLPDGSQYPGNSDSEQPDS